MFAASYSTARNARAVSFLRYLALNHNVTNVANEIRTDTVTIMAIIVGLGILTSYVLFTRRTWENGSFIYSCAVHSPNTSLETSEMEELTSMLQQVVRIDETPYDVLLVSGDMTGVSVGAHRDVLYECSWYFKTLFDGAEMKQEEEPTVFYLPLVSTECIKSIVKYCYTESFEDTDGCNVLELLSGAAFLQIPDLVSQCETLILACLGSGNWISVWRFAKDHFSNLATSVIRYVYDNFEELVNESEIYDLNLDELVEIVNVGELAVRQKVICSEVFFRWLHHDIDRLSYAKGRMNEIPVEVAGRIEDAIQRLTS